MSEKNFDTIALRTLHLGNSNSCTHKEVANNEMYTRTRDRGRVQQTYHYLSFKSYYSNYKMTENVFLNYFLSVRVFSETGYYEPEITIFFKKEVRTSKDFLKKDLSMRKVSTTEKVTGTFVESIVKVYCT